MPSPFAVVFRRARARAAWAAAVAGAVLSGCGSPATPAWRGAAYAPGALVGPADRPALSELGRALFFDPSLSASGRTSCATCHDPRFAYGPPDDLVAQRSGADGGPSGLRAVPSLRYLQTLPPFSEHYFDNDGDDSIDAGPTGGHMWDGRAGSAHEQARLPLLSPSEMANESPAAVVSRVAGSGSAQRLRQLFGDGVFVRQGDAFAAVVMALETFQQSPRDFYPYSSKYDAVLRGEAELSESERRGLEVFEDPQKGNCAACHPSRMKVDGAFPLFTDFGLIAIGVPRNAALPANADPGFHDLGLCGPLRVDLRDRAEYCGRFRTPSLRNVALRRSFFHNGVYRSLDEALRFYFERDVAPDRIYGRDASGQVRRFDDLPQRFRGNVDVEPPFGGRPGDPRAVDEQDLRDLAAFLHTLTDADAAASVPQRR